MDPYIDAERLDPHHRFFELKKENLRRADLEYQARAETLETLPVKITLQTTDACNLSCAHCQIPKHEKKPRMPLELMERVSAELFPTLIELHPTNLGEPFLWPHFEYLCRELDRSGVLLDLTTNGTLLSEERIAWIAPIARDIKISFDGATATTFERHRRGAVFEEVCENVRRLVRMLEKSPARPIVALQMTLMRSNFQEVPRLVELAAELGARRVKAYHLFTFSPEMERESLMFEQASWRRTLERAIELAARLGIELQCAEPLGDATEISLGRTHCHLPWHETWIDFDGEILPCHSHGGDSAGNIGERSFAEIWNSPLYRRIRRGYRGARLDWNCRGCGMNFQKTDEHQPVPYDAAGFLISRKNNPLPILGDGAPVRWSSRMRPFDLTGRRRGR